MRRFFIALLFIVLLCRLPMPLEGAVLFLKNGGQIEGELRNPDESPRKTYQITTKEGIGITLAAKDVEQVQRLERAALIEYNSTAPFTENSIENHLRLAKWCSENQLTEQAKIHWRQILVLDPDHADARTVLGYTKTAEGWVSQRERRENRGFILEKGRWRTPQQIEVEKILSEKEQIRKQWKDKVNSLCAKLPEERAERELTALRDPAAVLPLTEAMKKENNMRKRIIMLRTLSRIKDPAAFQFIAAWSVNPKEAEEVQRICLEELRRQLPDYPEAKRFIIDIYRAALNKESDLAVINLAAQALADMEGYEAIPELIDALVVTRISTRQETPTQSVDNMGNQSLVWGAKTITDRRDFTNQPVLTALRKLTGENFQFDQNAWREWYKQSLRMPASHLRRS